MPNAIQKNYPPKSGNSGRPATGSRGNLSPRPRSTVNWDEVPNQLLRDTVVTVTSAGAAIQFASTTDRGALVIKVFDGDNTIKEYPHSIEECEATLRWICDMFPSE